jgi:hypothetical protein
MSGGQMFAQPPVHELVRPWSLANAYKVRPDAFTRMVPRLVLAVCTVAADAAVVVVLAGAVVVVADEDPDDVVVVARSADAPESESSPPPPHAANPTASARAVTARAVRRIIEQLLGAVPDPRVTGRIRTRPPPGLPRPARA